MLSRLTRFIEHHPKIHRGALRAWRLFPPRLAGYLKGHMTRNWVVGAVAVMVDLSVEPPEVLLVEHSYRTKGSWGLPGGSLESVPGDPSKSRPDASPDDVIEEAVRQEIWEELGFDVDVDHLIRVDAIPFVAEEPGPYRLDFYFRCYPEGGFEALRRKIRSEALAPKSPEISQIRLVPLKDLEAYDLYSSDVRFLYEDLPRIEPGLGDFQH